MNVNEIMVTDAKSCSSDTTLDQVAMLMWEGNCGSIPVVDSENKPIGIITDRDIAMCCAINHKAPWELSASTIMADRALFTCSTDESLETALATMKRQKVRRLPVTDSYGYFTGMLSIDDVVACSAKGKTAKNMSYDTTMNTLKAVAIHH
ncbi:MAG: CBS domain-containing protein [Gammaproteobacteria bacterium]|nr:CBS domain-containing protein [Gammaproteobacteria bacterium]